MPALKILAVLLMLQLVACAGSRTEPVSGTLQGGTVLVERLPPAAQETGVTTVRPAGIDTLRGSVTVERLPPLPDVVPAVPAAAAPAVTPITPAVPVAPAAPATKPPVAAASPATATPAKPAPATSAITAEKTASNSAAAAKTATKPPAKVASAAQPQKPAAAAAKVGASTLDLDALEQRLKDTDAIGVFTKIALKNQVDDLLKRFKAYHESDGKTALTQLRQSYDQLLLKVNDVLKTGDPSLAGEIMGSREAIWGVLSDPVKFAKL